MKWAKQRLLESALLRRSPCGERGLKYKFSSGKFGLGAVAPRAGSVG